MKLNDIEIFPRANALLPVAWNHFSALLPAAWRYVFLCCCYCYCLGLIHICVVLGRLNRKHPRTRHMGPMWAQCVLFWANHEYSCSMQIRPEKENEKWHVLWYQIDIKLIILMCIYESITQIFMIINCSTLILDVCSLAAMVITNQHIDHFTNHKKIRFYCILFIYNLIHEQN